MISCVSTTTYLRKGLGDSSQAVVNHFAVLVYLPVIDDHLRHRKMDARMRKFVWDSLRRHLYVIQGSKYHQKPNLC